MRREVSREELYRLTITVTIDNVLAERSRRRPAKQQVLWEFLLETLSNPDYNPVYIEWVDRALGIFRFVQSQQVAKLWGQRRKRRNMCYEYFSRAMRSVVVTAVVVIAAAAVKVVVLVVAVSVLTLCYEYVIRAIKLVQIFNR